MADKINSHEDEDLPWPNLGCDEPSCHALAGAAAMRQHQSAEGPQTQAAADVLAERRRQVDVEGWSPEHDDEHGSGELAGAAATYAAYRSHVPPAVVMGEGLMQMLWPWSASWWKPTTPRRDLIKAGALILAEIERLDRAAAPDNGEAK